MAYIWPLANNSKEIELKNIPYVFLSEPFCMTFFVVKLSITVKNLAIMDRILDFHLMRGTY